MTEEQPKSRLQLFYDVINIWENYFLGGNSDGSMRFIDVNRVLTVLNLQVAWFFGL